MSPSSDEHKVDYERYRPFRSRNSSNSVSCYNKNFRNFSVNIATLDEQCKPTTLSTYYRFIIETILLYNYHCVSLNWPLWSFLMNDPNLE